MGAQRRAAVVTVSDGVTHGTREDTSGQLAEEILRGAGFDVAERAVVPDERPQIEEALRRLAGEGYGLVVTTGGTGFGPRDVTPEATRTVIDREAPGLAELMRRAGLEHTPLAALSRAVVGSRGPTLIVNLPGSPKGVRESLEAALSVVPHAVDLLAGQAGEHPTGHAEHEPGAVHGRAAPYGSPPSWSQGISRMPAGWVHATAVKVDGDPPCRVGNVLRIVPDGPVAGTLGCAEFDSAATADAAEVLASGEPQTRSYHHELGDIEVYLEPYPAPPRLVVVSATEVATHLLNLGPQLGYGPVLVETREERISRIHREWAGEIRQTLDGLELTERDAVVATDHDAPGVPEAVAAALRSAVGFVGVMGSRRHVGPHVEALRAMGFSEDELARVRSPVGLDIGARSPEEIALSIAAGLVAARAERDGGWLDR